jgi:ATP-binding cassette subfamily B protein
MNARMQSYCWPTSRLGEALVETARHGRLLREVAGRISPPVNIEHNDDDALSNWMRAVLRPMQLEAESAEISYEDIEAALPRVGPGLVRLPESGGSCFLAIIRRNGSSVVVIGPDRQRHRVACSLISAALRENLGEPLRRDIARMMTSVVSNDITERERAALSDAVTREQLGTLPIGGIWRLRLSPAAPFASQLSQAGLFKTLGGLVSIYALQYLLGLTAWWIIGAAVIEGRIDSGWLVAWVLVLVTGLPLQMIATWYQGLFAIGGGGLLKRRLLYGALRLQPEEVRNQGAGQLLGQVIESEAVESLALNAGFASMLAVIELLVAVAILALGAGGWHEVLLFVVWIAVASSMCWGLWTRCFQWTLERLSLTHDLVEKMVGHRTRLVQERIGEWHEDEDLMLEQYVKTSHGMDRRAALMGAILPQGWLILGVVGLAPAFISGTASPGALGVGLGGIILASGALQRMCSGFSAIAGASIAWRQVAQLFHAAARPEVVGSPTFADSFAEPELTQTRIDDDRAPAETILEASHVSFHHQGRDRPVLNGVNLRIASGERILLEGASGSGKSTLAAILSGLRAPESGVVFLSGLDMRTLGTSAWRQRVAMAPQFHENYILTGTMAFNLLMGRNWPPKPEDLIEAEAICSELGLDQLISRMPAGLSQLIGESGWQLSHGERSRLFLARSLLQRSELVIFDESLGTLDSENMFNALRCASQRAKALLVIAHP